MLNCYEYIAEYRPEPELHVKTPSCVTMSAEIAETTKQALELSELFSLRCAESRRLHVHAPRCLTVFHGEAGELS